MTSERILFTTLPNGLQAGNGLLSVFVSPRLTTTNPGGGVLSEFPNWLDWPAQIRSVTQWTVTLDFFGGVNVPATVVSPSPRSDLWKALFRTTTPVLPYAQEDLSRFDVRSYTTATIHDWLRSFYVDMTTRTQGEAQDPDTGYPDFVGLWGSYFSDFPLERIDAEGYYDYEWGRLDNLDVELREFGYTPAADVPDQAFLQLKRFHDRPPVDTKPPQVPPFDFHQLVSLLGDHPQLLRLLGLVVDLRIGDPGTPFFPYVRTTPTWSPAVTPVVDNRPTQWRVGTFRPVFVGADVVNDAFLALNDPNQFGVNEVDLDGGGLRFYEWLRSMWWRFQYLFTNFPLHDAISSDDQFQPAPALRSGGLSVFQRDRAAATSNLLSRGPALASTSFYNGDALVRGLRIDVWDDASNQWRQLCARVLGGPGGFRFLRTNTVVGGTPEEGWVSPSLAVDDPAGSVAHQGESLFRWGGWSLVGQRPGRPFSVDPGQAPVDAPGNPSGTSLQLEVIYDAQPGTLPKLRFGRTYRFRARLVDLAGNSVGFDPTFDASFPAMSAPVFYGRLEPLQSPALVMRTQRGEGASTEHLVIRSNFDVLDSTVGTSERHVAPPMTSQEMAETHGLLDTPAGKLSKTVYPMVVQRDGKTFAGGGTPDADNYGAPYYDVDQLDVPYLPDPIAVGAALAGVPGTNAIITVPFYGSGATWPVSRAFRIRLAAGNSAPILPTPANGNVLTLFVPKGRTRTFDLSSILDGPGLGVMAIWNWMVEAGINTSFFRPSILKGQQWTLTPRRSVRLTHAVRQPNVAPEPKNLFSDRLLIGQTDALISGGITIDRPSTSRLDLIADWDEPIDPLGEAGPRTVRGGGTAASVALDENLGAIDSHLLNVRHEFHDTKHRNIAYSIVGTSRFVEYFGVRRKVKLTSTTPLVLDPAGVVPGTVVVQTIPVNLGDAVTPFVLGTDYVVDEAAGSITRTATSAIPSGVNVNVRYVVPPVTRSSLDTITSPETGRGYPVNVLSTARPSVAVVRSIVPVFEWQGPGTRPAVLQSTRLGNTLRVYLERPWWSSGDGELLGVVLAQGTNPSGTASDAVQQHVTLWGRDPIFAGAAVRASLPASLNAFPLAVATGSNLSLDEVPGLFVDVAGHAVQYDADRRLWYSDIRVDLGSSYDPFLRLALVRYQPDSITDAHLSRVSITDVYPLAPNRSAAVAFDPLQADRVTVTVSGITYRSDSVEHAPAAVTVEVETRRSAVPGALGWQSAGAPTLLVAQAPVSGVTTWTGGVKLPDDRGTRPMRLVIREAEQYRSASGATDARVVYLDTIEI